MDQLKKQSINTSVCEKSSGCLVCNTVSIIEDLFILVGFMGRYMPPPKCVSGAADSDFVICHVIDRYRPPWNCNPRIHSIMAIVVDTSIVFLMHIHTNCCSISWVIVCADPCSIIGCCYFHHETEY